MFLEVLSKLASESLLSLYPIFVKKIGISSSLQLWTRLITYVSISVFFVNWSFIKSSLFTLDSLTLGLVNLSHVFFSYEGFRNLDSGVSFAIFNSYPLMILLLAGTLWHNSYLLVILGLLLFIYGNYAEKTDIKETKEMKKTDKKESSERNDSETKENFNYGVIMILLAAFTEALIYFLVRRIKTTNNWNHVFISYFLGAVLMTAYSIYNYADISLGLDKARMGLSIIINGIIGTLGYFLRFFASYRLEPEVYAPLSYFGVIMSYVYGISFENESLNWKKVLGTVSILASNYFAPIKDSG
jgi:drug/metabolite transporter (DMT)-like permease